MIADVAGDEEGSIHIADLDVIGVDAYYPLFEGTGGEVQQEPQGPARHRTSPPSGGVGEVDVE